MTGGLSVERAYPSKGVPRAEVAFPEMSQCVSVAGGALSAHRPPHGLYRAAR